MGQIQFTIALVMIGLFSVAVIGFATNFANDNSVAVDISDDSALSSLYTKQTGNLTQFGNDTQATYSSIANSTISAGDETTRSGGQFKITPVTAITFATSILYTGYTKIFGSDSGFAIFITTFLGLIVFIMGLYIWKTWAGRNPE